MILGKTCTRGCRFCAVKQGHGAPVDSDEAVRVATAAKSMGLSYVVITSVTRDDLPDGGAAQFADTVRAVREFNSQASVEVLTPDYSDENLKTVLQASPTVFAHNLETVERLSPKMRHARFSYRRSLNTLGAASGFCDEMITKSSLMLGLGESETEVMRSMRDLREVGVKILVLGQYLQPTGNHASVAAFVPPAQFDAYANHGYEIGFEFVAAAPLARTSWHAAEAYVKSKHAR